MVKSPNIVKELFNNKTTEGLAHYKNIKRLLNSIKEFTETPTEDGELVEAEKSLGSYLHQITLLTDADKGDIADSDVVKLMTICYKRTEFPVVFSMRLEENLFK